MSVEFVPAGHGPTPFDFVKFVPYVCSQMQAPFCIEIKQHTIEEYVSKEREMRAKSKSKRAIDIPTEASTTAQPEHPTESSSAPFSGLAHGSAVLLTAMCDSIGRLVELQFCRCPLIPTLLLRAIALCVPFQPALARVTVRWGPPMSNVLRELAALLPHSNVVELCLDDSPTLERNCHVLLEQHTQLRSLSLARCDLDDEDCTLLAARLCHPEPASRSLVALCLASNAIADAGATALGDALRTNRTLRHLNLAGNQITDTGAAGLLLSLGTFRLRPEEVAAKRGRLLDHLKKKEVIYAKCLNELLVASAAADRRDKSPPGTKKRPAPTRARRPSVTARADTRSALALRAEAMAGEQLGPLLEPFGAEHTLRRADGLHCVGNLALSHLNLAYNDLQLGSLALLVRVLRAQACVAGAVGAPGLLRVQLDGNLLPCACAELELASELLAAALGASEPKQPGKRTDRAKKK